MRMLTKSRVLVGVAAVGLLATLVLPLWRINLVAPQYPEGLGMKIWAHQITGDLRDTVIIIGCFFVLALVLLFLVPRKEVKMPAQQV